MTGTPRPPIVAECRDCLERHEFATRAEALNWQRGHAGHFTRIVTPASKHAYGKRP